MVLVKTQVSGTVSYLAESQVGSAHWTENRGDSKAFVDGAAATAYLDARGGTSFPVVQESGLGGITNPSKKTHT